PQAQATQTNLMLEFREPGFHLLSFPLCLRELRGVGQLASTLSGQFIPVDSQIFISSTRALCLLRAGSATFGAANVSVSTIANIQLLHQLAFTGDAIQVADQQDAQQLGVNRRSSRLAVTVLQLL